MKTEREKETIDVLKTLSLEGSELALNLLLKIMKDEVEKDIGGIKVSLVTYNAVVGYLKQNNKVKAIKVLREIFGSEYSLFEYKEAIETLNIIPQN